MQCRLRPLQPPRTQVLVAEYIKGSCGISPARATVSLTEMEQRARARAAEEAAAERQQQAMLASLAASIAQQARLTYSPAPKGWSHCVASPNEAQGLL